MPTWGDVQKKIASRNYSDAIVAIYEVIKTSDQRAIQGVIAGLNGEDGDTLRILFAEVPSLSPFSAWGLFRKSLIERLVNEEEWFFIAELKPAFSKIVEERDSFVFTDILFSAAIGLYLSRENKDRAELIERASSSLLSVQEMKLGSRCYNRKSELCCCSAIDLFAFVGNFSLYEKARHASAEIDNPFGYLIMDQGAVVQGRTLLFAIAAKQWEMLKAVCESPDWSSDCFSHLGEIVVAAAKDLPNPAARELILSLFECARDKLSDSFGNLMRAHYSGEVIKILVEKNEADLLKAFLMLGICAYSCVGALKSSLAFLAGVDSQQYKGVSEIILEAVEKLVQATIWLVMEEFRLVDVTEKSRITLESEVSKRLHQALGQFEDNGTVGRIKNRMLCEFSEQWEQAKLLAGEKISQLAYRDLTVSAGSNLVVIMKPVFELLQISAIGVVLERLAGRLIAERRLWMSEQEPEKILASAQSKLASLVAAIVFHQKALPQNAVRDIVLFLPSVLAMTTQSALPLTLPSKKSVETDARLANDVLFGKVVATVVDAVVRLEVQRKGFCHPRLAVEAARTMLKKINDSAGLRFESSLETWLGAGFANLDASLKVQLHHSVAGMFGHQESSRLASVAGEFDWIGEALKQS